MKIKNLKKNKGFTLLFAVIVSTLVLAVGASIISIALKQVLLSGVGRDSQFAFYAANTGIECALYWELKGLGVDEDDFSPAFPNSNSIPSYTSSQKEKTKCAEVKILSPGVRKEFGDFKIESSLDVQGFKVSSFRINNFKDSQDNDLPYCVDVFVKKKGIQTIIDARGYNTCDKNNPRRIERGLELYLNKPPNP